MDDDLVSRRQNAAAAFIQRRGELNMTQEQVADAAGVVLRTVQNFEYGVWPNPRTRARLERAVGWSPGEISRLASPAKAYIDPQLLDRARELDDEQAEWMIRFLEEQLLRKRDGGRGRSASGG